MTPQKKLSLCKREEERGFEIWKTLNVDCDQGAYITENK
jgi:hypothetical protein